jgi:hypothetical protein
MVLGKLAKGKAIRTGISRLGAAIPEFISTKGKKRAGNPAILTGSGHFYTYKIIRFRGGCKLQKYDWLVINGNNCHRTN